ncbi:MAG: prepilin peptidase [Bradymonadia bacterium]
MAAGPAGLTGDLIFGPLLGVALITAAIWDVTRRKVPNTLNLGVWCLGVVYQLVRWGFEGLLDGALGTALGFALVIIPFALRLHRGGDAKLIMALGMWLGPLGIFWTYLWGIAVGGLVAVVLLMVSGPELRARVMRHLGLSAKTLTLPHVEPERDARQHVPMALAFAAGAVLAIIV